MREIEFRAKRDDNNEWAYGSFVGGEYIMTYKQEKKFAIGGWYDGKMCEINPNTVGQYTGLTDKNGTKIFEGDIVHIVGDQLVEDWKNVNYSALIIFKDGGFCAIDDKPDDYGFARYDLTRCDFDMEIIGNIHDNPELFNN